MRKNNEDEKKKKEFLSECPRITMLGSTQLFVENFKAIIICEDKNIKLSTTPFMLNISGDNLLVRSITTDIIEIGGDITGIHLEK